MPRPDNNMPKDMDTSDQAAMVESLAKLAHEMNRAYCTALGDTSQLSWEDAPDWQKQSARKGVQYHLDNPGASPSDSHNSWLREKAMDGWVWGPVKNAELKQHPCYVAYEKLPVEQRAKDYIFIAAVRQGLILLG